MKILFNFAFLLTMVLWVEAEQIQLPYNQACQFGPTPVCARNIQGDLVYFINRCDFNAFNRNFLAFGFEGLKEESCYPISHVNPPLFNHVNPTKHTGPVCGVTTSCSYTFTNISDLQTANQASLKWAIYGFGRCEDLLPQNVCTSSIVQYSPVQNTTDYNGTTTADPTTTTTTTTTTTENPTNVPTSNCNSINPIVLGQQIQPSKILPLTKSFVDPSNFAPTQQQFDKSALPLSPLNPALLLPNTANPSRITPYGYKNQDVYRPYTNEENIQYQQQKPEEDNGPRIVFRHMPRKVQKSPRPFSTYSHNSSPETVDISELYKYI